VRCAVPCFYCYSLYLRACEWLGSHTCGAEKQSSTACLFRMRLALITSPAARNASRVQPKEKLYQGQCTYTGEPWLKTAVSYGKAPHYLTRRTAGTGAAEEQAARLQKRGLRVACAPTARRTPRLQARRRAPEDDVELDDDYGWAEARCSRRLVPAPMLCHWMGMCVLNQQHSASHCHALHSGGAWMRRGTRACSPCSSRSGQLRLRRSTAWWTLQRTTRQRASRGARRATAARPYGHSTAGAVLHCARQAGSLLPTPHPASVAEVTAAS